MRVGPGFLEQIELDGIQAEQKTTGDAPIMFIVNTKSAVRVSDPSTFVRQEFEFRAQCSLQLGTTDALWLCNICFAWDC